MSYVFEKQIPDSSVVDPDLEPVGSGSGNMDRIQIRFQSLKTLQKKICFLFHNFPTITLPPTKKIKNFMPLLF
jgi:hypothetical protein